MATIPFGVAEPLAVAASVPLAVMGGTEGPFESYYRCETKYAAAMSAGLVRSVRSLSFAAKTPSSQVLFLGTVKTPRKPFVPAVAEGPGGVRQGLRPREDARTRFVARTRANLRLMDAVALSSIVYAPAKRLGPSVLSHRRATEHAAWVSDVRELLADLRTLADLDLVKVEFTFPESEPEDQLDALKVALDTVRSARTSLASQTARLLRRRVEREAASLLAEFDDVTARASAKADELCALLAFALEDDGADDERAGVGAPVSVPPELSGPSVPFDFT